jgi:hypothetical protein
VEQFRAVAPVDFHQLGTDDRNDFALFDETKKIDPRILVKGLGLEVAGRSRPAIHKEHPHALRKRIIATQAVDGSQKPKGKATWRSHGFTQILSRAFETDASCGHQMTRTGY